MPSKKKSIKKSAVRRNRISNPGSKSLKRKACSGMRVKHRKISGWQQEVGAIMRSAALKRAHPDDINARLVEAVRIAKSKKRSKKVSKKSKKGSKGKKSKKGSKGKKARK